MVSKIYKPKNLIKMKKNYYRTRFFFLISLFLVFITSCEKDDPFDKEDIFYIEPGYFYTMDGVYDPQGNEILKTIFPQGTTFTFVKDHRGFEGEGEVIIVLPLITNNFNQNSSGNCFDQVNGWYTNCNNSNYYWYSQEMITLPFTWKKKDQEHISLDFNNYPKLSGNSREYLLARILEGKYKVINTAGTIVKAHEIMFDGINNIVLHE
jgi:hypothetical protein